MIYFTDHYNAVFLSRLPSKTKTGKGYANLIIIFFHVSPSSPQLQRICFFIKNVKSPFFSK